MIKFSLVAFLGTLVVAEIGFTQPGGFGKEPEKATYPFLGKMIEPICELFIPNGFSPDGDGINDFLKIRCIEKYPDAYFEVYNRWGNLVYKKTNYGNIEKWGDPNAWWDGSCNTEWKAGNGKLPAGTYMYILKLNDGVSQPVKGTIFLNR
jgi:gliding motility-associated-like protein